MELFYREYEVNLGWFEAKIFGISIIYEKNCAIVMEFDLQLSAKLLVLRTPLSLIFIVLKKLIYRSNLIAQMIG